MKQFNGAIVLLLLDALGVIPGWGKLMPVVQQSPDLAAVTANIMKSCYVEKVKEVGIVGDVPDSFFATLSTGEPIATVLIDNDERPVETDAVSKWSRHKLHVFVITAPSPLELERILVDLRNSRWWNHMAQFYILDSSAKETGCSGTFGFLWTAWRMDILGAKFICNQGADESLIYTFNPYTDYAPSPWKLERTYKGVNEHPWALLVQKYHERLNKCENIDFDPTKEAGKYEARMTVSESDVFLNSTKNGRISPYEHTDIFLQIMSRYMNITLKFVLHPTNESIHALSFPMAKNYVCNRWTLENWRVHRHHS
ncbi:uncharacterized protein [Venturia canescens]|uniref:uncharacterized protein n=1 Tax=Venturia canescens TaxID=32260 RepID=UPI001C9C05EC|nr:uncharacterized protein LOC122407439 [Venturia canescens]